MTMTPEGIVAGAGVLWGVFERWRSMIHTRRAATATEKAVEATAQQAANEEVIRAKDRVIDTIKQDGEAWKERWTLEHAEFVATRQGHHDQIEKINGKLLAMAEVNADLQAKTDLTPLAVFANNQTKWNQEMMESHGKIMDTQGRMMETQEKILECLLKLTDKLES